MSDNNSGVPEPAAVRGQETERLVAQVDSLTDGVGGISLVTGGAGLGKTWLLRAVLDRAVQRGCRVLSATAQEYDQGIAFSTLQDMLASLGQPVEEHVHQARSAALAAVSGAIPSEPPEGSARARQATSPYPPTTQLLRELTRSAPLVLAVDDAHLADDESLTALCLAARHLAGLPILSVFAARDSDTGQSIRLAATVGRLVDSESGHTTELHPLARSELHVLASTLVGGHPDHDLVSYVYEQSRGNPLFASETLRSLQARDAIRVEDGTHYLLGDPGPPKGSGRGALLHRVFQQDRHTRELARVLSVFRRIHPAHMPLVSDLTALDPEPTRAAFDRLCAAGTIVRGRGEWFEFAHPLMAEVLYDDLGPVERRRIHRRIAERRGSHGQAEQLSFLEWARHVAEAAEPGDRQAFDTMLHAAKLSWDAAPLSAARWYQRALDLVGADSPEGSSLLARQAVSYWKGSRPDAAVESGRAALDRLEPGGKYASSLRTVVNATYAMGRLEDALHLIDAALPALEQPDPVLAQRGLVLAHLGRTNDALEQVGAAWTAADRMTPEAQAIAYSHLGHVENWVGDYAGVRTAADRLRALGHSTEALAPSARLSALSSAAYLFSRAGVLPPARELLDDIKELSVRAGGQDVGGQVAYTTARVQYLAGEWTTALKTVHAGAVRLEFSGLRKNLVSLRLIEVRILHERGQYAEALAALEAIDVPADWAIFAAMLATIRARITLGLRSYVTALPELRRQADAGRTNRWREVSYLALDGLVTGHLAVGDRAGAWAATKELGVLAQQCRIPKIRRKADLCAALVYGRPEIAHRVLEQARKDGLPFVVARAHSVLGALGERPQENLDRAWSGYDRLLATDAQRPVQAWARDLGVSLQRDYERVPAIPGFTATEAKLAGLVRDGLSNPEISEVMHYSRKTVEAYLSRIYRKTGCRSRLDLIVALERGLLASRSEDANTK